MTTPVYIQLLIAVLCQPRKAWSFDPTAPAYATAITALLRDRIIMRLSFWPPEEYELTERGNAWLDQMLSTPYPVTRWVDPRFEKTT